MKQFLVLSAASMLLVTGAMAQAKKPVAKKPASAAHTASNTGGFTKLPSGLQYRIVKDVPGNFKPSVGDYMEFHIKSRCGDSLLFDSRKMNGNQPVPFTVQAPAFKGDVAEGFMLLTQGDSAQFRVPVDSLVKTGAQLPPWMKKGQHQMIDYDVQVVTIKSKETMAAEAKEKSEKQVSVDDALIQDYLTKNNIKATKTSSGLYYKIDRQGAGISPVPGDSVSMNYTGRLLNGKTFDSNVDSNFHHVQAFWFNLGMHNVIPGWDEGIALLKKGTKGTLYIPSRMAYGANGQGPIPANSVLVFDVELVDMRHHEGK